MSLKSKWAVVCGVTSISICMMSLEVSAQVTAYPAKGQSPEQQEIDKAACQDFAKGQTGFDPQQALSASSSQNTTQNPPAVRARKRAREEQAEIAQQDQQKAQMQKKLQAYNNAETVCLKGRGYSVG